MFQSFAIVPAAGRSRRMGRPKLLLPDRGTSVIETVLNAWQESCVDQTIVVARRDDDALIRVCRQHPVHVVTPQVDPPEMKDSVVAALDYVRDTFRPRTDDAWLMAPADVPYLSTTVIDRLVQAYRSDSTEVLVPVHQERRGHPVLLAWPTSDAVRALGADEGINRLLDRLPSRNVESGEACLLRDLDTPEDYERHQRREGGH